jgi:hypothetical protein
LEILNKNPPARVVRVMTELLERKNRKSAIVQTLQIFISEAMSSLARKGRAFELYREM